MPEEFRSFIICDRFNWTEDEYNAASAAWCDRAMRLISIEAEIQDTSS